MEAFAWCLLASAASGAIIIIEKLVKFGEARVLPAIARGDLGVPPPCSPRHAVFWSVSGWYTS